jgi:hypothetical protein
MPGVDFTEDALNIDFGGCKSAPTLVLSYIACLAVFGYFEGKPLSSVPDEPDIDIGRG